MRQLREIQPETWEVRTIMKFMLIPRTLRRPDWKLERRWLERARGSQRDGRSPQSQ